LLAAAVTLVACGIACTTPAVARPSAGGSLAAGGGPAADLAAPTSTSSSPELQRIADEELDRLMTESGGAAGLILVLDPSTGEILADAGRAHGAPADVAVEASYVPGSTLKAVTLAGGLEDGMVSADERFDCEQGTWSYRGQVVHDSETHGVLTVPQMLAVSSNVGFVKVFDRMGVDRLDRWLRAFHFGVAPAIAGAATGSLPEKRDDGSSVAALTAIGEGATASPLQVAAAYAVFANDGEYVAPTRARRSAPAPRERLVKPETARAVVRMLEEVVYADRSTGHKAQVEGFRVAGKTGTASWSLPGGGEGIYASFVGIVPSASPRLVILVGVEQPKGETAGGLVAAPVFARVAARALAAR
jgi:cell division protein FtsI (penicillin-binding protein 3)